MGRFNSLFPLHKKKFETAVSKILYLTLNRAGSCLVLKFPTVQNILPFQQIEKSQFFFFFENSLYNQWFTVYVYGKNLYR